MSTDDTQELSVAFEFPGVTGLLKIGVNRIVVEKNEAGKYVMPPELELALSAVPGVIFDSRDTEAGRYSINIEIAAAFDRDTLLVRIATALANYYQVTEDMLKVSVTDRRPQPRNIFI